MVAIGRAGQVNVAQQQVNFQRIGGHSSHLLNHAEWLTPHAFGCL
jgi:hypothetical protein